MQHMSHIFIIQSKHTSLYVRLRASHSSVSYQLENIKQHLGICFLRQSSDSILRNLERMSTLRTWHIVSYYCISKVTLKTLKAERVNTRQQSRILGFPDILDTVFMCFTCSHCFDKFWGWYLSRNSFKISYPSNQLISHRLSTKDTYFTPRCCWLSVCTPITCWIICQ